MKTIFNEKDRIMIRGWIYCYLVQNATIKRIPWSSYYKLSAYEMINKESEFWGTSAKNYKFNGHYELDVDFIEA